MAGRKRPSIPGYYSIREFCERYSVSPSFYYKMQKEGGGPRETVLLGQRRKVIAHKAAEAWHARHNPPVTMVKAGPSGDNRYYTIEEFCKQYRISHSYYYQMQNRGAGPGEMKLASRFNPACGQRNTRFGSCPFTRQNVCGDSIGIYRRAIRPTSDASGRTGILDATVRRL